MRFRKSENLFTFAASTSVLKETNGRPKGGYCLECDQWASAACPYGQYTLDS